MGSNVEEWKRPPCKIIAQLSSFCFRGIFYVHDFWHYFSHSLNDGAPLECSNSWSHGQNNADFGIGDTLCSDTISSDCSNSHSSRLEEPKRSNVVSCGCKSLSFGSSINDG
jgi:hypothetical protein